MLPLSYAVVVLKYNYCLSRFLPFNANNNSVLKLPPTLKYMHITYKILVLALQIRKQK